MALDERRQSLWESISMQRPRSFIDQLVMGQDIWLENHAASTVQNLLAFGVNRVVDPDALSEVKMFIFNGEQQIPPKAQWHAALRGVSAMFFFQLNLFLFSAMSPLV